MRHASCKSPTKNPHNEGTLLLHSYGDFASPYFLHEFVGPELSVAVLCIQHCSRTAHLSPTAFLRPAWMPVPAGEAGAEHEGEPHSTPCRQHLSSSTAAHLPVKHPTPGHMLWCDIAKYRQQSKGRGCYASLHQAGAVPKLRLACKVPTCVCPRRRGVQNLLQRCAHARAVDHLICHILASQAAPAGRTTNVQCNL